MKLVTQTEEVCTESAQAEKFTTHVYHGDGHGDPTPGRDTVPLCMAKSPPTHFWIMAAGGEAEMLWADKPGGCYQE